MKVVKTFEEFINENDNLNEKRFEVEYDELKVGDTVEDYNDKKWIVDRKSTIANKPAVKKWDTSGWLDDKKAIEDLEYDQPIIAVHAASDKNEKAVFVYGEDGALAYHNW